MGDIPMRDQFGLNIKRDVIMKVEKTELACYLITIGGILIIIWGLLHSLIIPVIQQELTSANVDTQIVSLITLSYLGIVVMISMGGVLVIYSAWFGVIKGEKWAWIVCFSHGALFAFVTILLITLQPKISILQFSGEVVLILAIGTDGFAALFILLPLIIWKKRLTN